MISRISRANALYLSINQHTLHWENESVIRGNLHQFLWHLEDSGVNQGKKSKELWQTLLCQSRKLCLCVWAESCGSLLTFLLPLNSNSESFQGRKFSLEPTAGHSCLFLSVCAGIHTLPTHATLLCFSLIATAMSQDMLPLEDQFPVCALAVWYQFPPILDFRQFCEVWKFLVIICLVCRLLSKEGNQDSHF